MKRNMFREYIADWSWNKIKEGTSENKAVWSCMYASFIMMFSASGSIAGENFQLTDALLSIGTFLPIGIVMISVMEHPIRLRKMRYLCPQTEEERARSVRRTYYFRVGIHMIIFLMGLLLLFSVGFFHWESLVFLLLNDFMLSTIVPVNGVNGKAVFQLVVLLIAIMLTNMAQLVVISGPEPHRTVQIILYAIFFLIELPLFIGFSKYIKKELCAAKNFEEAM